MSRGRGRKLALALIAVALVLAAGRWLSEFAADRLWEAGVGQRVAAAGMRRALLGTGLELVVIVLAVGWFLVHFVLAARIALPDHPPPDRSTAKLWPTQLPRWSLGILALVMGVFLGAGAGKWLDELLLTLSGVRFGVPDPLLGADLGVFVRNFPLALDLRHKATLLVAAALGGVVLLHLAGDTIRIADRRLWIWPRARPQLAVLLALLALTLGWACALEPYRLAAGLRGPLLSSEFALRSVVARIQVGLAALSALLSLLWWYRMRGALVLLLWLLFGVVVVAGRGMPFHGSAAVEDPNWRSSARALDSIAFELAGLESSTQPVRQTAGVLRPTLWDDSVLPQAAVDSGRLSEPHRGWLSGPLPPQPVWYAVRNLPGQAPALLALSDDRASPSGALLAWREGDTLPLPEIAGYRQLREASVRPLAPRVVVNQVGLGVGLNNWAKRVVLAWALQVPAAFTAPKSTHLAWRLDPGERLKTVAPFAHWTVPRARLLGTSLVWQSDGLLASGLFPSSGRVEWNGADVSMLRSTFLGLVDALSGEVQIFRRDPADSLGAAWARITAPLIESPSAIPREVLEREAYPDELLAVQARVLESAPWSVGRLEKLANGRGLLAPEAPGGSEHLVPFLHPNDPDIGALLLARRTPAGDSLRLIRLDSLWTVEGSATLNHRWEIFPFQQAMRDSVLAAGGTFTAGLVRYALASDGVLAYQPAWSITPSGHAHLVLVNVALGRPNRADRMSLGAGRTLEEAWTNFRGEPTPVATGSGAQAILEQARRLMLHADSALKRGDLPELGKTLAYLRDLLGPRHP